MCKHLIEGNHSGHESLFIKRQRHFRSVSRYVLSSVLSTMFTDNLNDAIFMLVKSVLQQPITSKPRQRAENTRNDEIRHPKSY